MSWNLQLTGPAQKDFRKLPQKEQPRVRAALLAMQEDPFAGDIKEHLIVVAGILRRTSTTY